MSKCSVRLHHQFFTFFYGKGIRGIRHLLYMKSFNGPLEKIPFYVNVEDQTCMCGSCSVCYTCIHSEDKSSPRQP